MEDYCSDCSNLDCSCFKKFVQNVSKRNVPSTSARITLLNNLFTLVGTMQYNIFSDAFIAEIKKSLGDISLYIDCSDITLTYLKAKILLLKSLIIEKIKLPDANSSSSSSSSISSNSEINYENFMKRIYDQLERTTFLYGKPNNNILYYEEIFYSNYENNEAYKTIYTKHACGIFYKDDNLYLCCSGFKKNIFNIFYALKSIPDIRLNEHKETIGKNLIIILKIFIYIALLKFNESFRTANLKIKHTEEEEGRSVDIRNITDYTSFYQNLLKLFGDPITEGGEVQEGTFTFRSRVLKKFRQLDIGDQNFFIGGRNFLRFQFDDNSKFDENRENYLSNFTLYNGNIDTIIADFQEILIRNELFDHVEADIKREEEGRFNLNKQALISKCIQETNGIENCNPQIYSDTLTLRLTLPDILTLHDSNRDKNLNFIENVKYRDNYFETQSDKNKIKGQYIPFKRVQDDELVCYNGSTCVEPKLFNWLINNRKIEKGKKPEFFSCFWHGPKSPNSMTMFVAQTSSDDKKKLFLLGYYSYLFLLQDKALQDKAHIPINSFLKPEKLNPVFNNIMLPCSGCQINYDDILNNKIENDGFTLNENYSWDSSSCGTFIPLYNTIYSPSVSRSNSSQEEEAPERREEERPWEGPTPWSGGGKKTNKSGQNKTKTNKSRQNKTKKIKKSKKSKTRKTKGKKRHNSRKLR
jgi:hypothetical protein